jgi:hypothetical protein
MTKLEEWNNPYGFQGVELAQEVIDELLAEVDSLREQLQSISKEEEIDANM